MSQSIMTNVADEEGSDPPFLVQKEMISAKGDKVVRDFFVIVGPR
jgi:hypothetical protein